MSISNRSYRPLAIGIVALAFSALVLDRALAGDQHFFAPVADPLVKEECGSCHLAFAPSMLPAKSWQRMMVNLIRTSGITPVLIRPSPKNHPLSRCQRRRRRWSALQQQVAEGRGLGQCPQRITELPKWVREHRKVPDWEWRHKDVRTKANCVACHTGAEQGYYDE